MKKQPSSEKAESVLTVIAILSIKKELAIMLLANRFHLHLYIQYDILNQAALNVSVPGFIHYMP